MRKRVLVVFLIITVIAVAIFFIVKTKGEKLNLENRKQLLTEHKILSEKEAEEYGEKKVSPEDEFGYYCNPILIDGKVKLKLNVVTRKSEPEGEQIENVWVKKKKKKYRGFSYEFKLDSAEVNDGSVLAVGHLVLKQGKETYNVPGVYYYGGASVFE